MIFYWRYKKIFQIGLTAIIFVISIFAASFYFFGKWENSLIEENKNICAVYANKIALEIEDSDSLKKCLTDLRSGSDILKGFSDKVEESVSGLMKTYMAEVEGLEGGLYLEDINDFVGYAFPTSDPPVPVYGPPPRSYNIIRDQAIKTISSKQPIVNIHAFDPAVFPLATCPISFGDIIIGSVWVRVHIERKLPVAKLRRVVNLLTIISLVGFVTMALFTLFLSNGIKTIRKELIDVKKNPGYRLNLRGGWFGFIPASINEMLDLIEKEYDHQRKLEKELEQKEKLASLGKMIAGVAHEVKTPLSIVKMRVQMWEKVIMENREICEKIDQESFNLVINEINRLSKLLNRLVIFSRPIDEKLKPVKLNMVLEEVISLINFESKKKGIRIKSDIKNDLPQIMADANSLKQVFINVLTNSIESIEKNGEIWITTKYSIKEEFVIIDISDTGKGIPDDIRDYIFDPFFTSKESGTGLGLSISHEIVVAHHGSISFSKNNGGGTKCIILLPVNKERE